MATGPIRRMSPANAAARAAPVPRAAPPQRAAPQPRVAPQRRTEEVARGHVSSTASNRRVPYHEQSTEVELLRTEFKENEHPAFVRVGAGLTINMHEFNSLRLDVAITIPCHPKDIEEAYEIGTQFVVDRLSEEEVNWLGRSTRTPKSKGDR